LRGCTAKNADYADKEAIEADFLSWLYPRSSALIRVKRSCVLLALLYVTVNPNGRA
jgi:hypothetical protein